MSARDLPRVPSSLSVSNGRWLDPLLVAGLCLFVFSFGLTSSPFWDDEHLLAAAARLRTPLDAFAFDSLGLSGTEGRQTFWRPLATLSFALEKALGADVLLHRATNGVLHAASAILALGWLRRRARAAELPAESVRFGTLALALLWATAPGRAEAVSWISARPDLLGTFFVLGGAALFARVSSATTRTGVLLGTLFGAMLSKEAYVFAPALLFLETTDDDARTRRVRWLLLATLGLGYAGWRHHFVGLGGGGRSLLANLPVPDRIFLFLETLGYALDGLLRPWKAELFRGTLGFDDEGLLLELPHAALGLVGLAGLLIFARKVPRARSWLGVLGLIYLPVANVLPTGIEARLCDRYLYLPALVVLGALPPFASKLRPKVGVRFVPALVALLVLTMAGLGAKRAYAFGRPVVLLRATLANSRPPHSIYRQAGFEFVEAGLLDEARTAYLGALSRREELGLPPPLADALEALRLEVELAPPTSPTEREFLAVSRCLLEGLPELATIELDGGARRLEFVCNDPGVAHAISPYASLLRATRSTLAARAGLDVRDAVREEFERCPDCTRAHLELAEAALALTEPALALRILGTDPHASFARAREFARLQTKLLARGEELSRLGALFLGAAYRPLCLAGESRGLDGPLVSLGCTLAGLRESSKDSLLAAEVYRSQPARRRALVEERLLGSP